MKFLIIILFSLLPHICLGQVDYNVQSLVRSFPTAIFVKGTLGYSLPLYKKNDTFLYGYIRPSASLQTSAVVNTGQVRLDFNPISFVNLYYGKSYTKRNYENLSNFDCNSIVCSADISRDHYGLRMALKVKSIVYSGALNYYQATRDVVTPQDFADELSSLVNTGSKSILIQNQHMLGYQLSDKWLVGYLGQLNKMRNNQQTSAMNLVIAQHQYKPEWKIIGGLGSFKTRTGATNGTMIGVLTWTPQKGLPLF